MKNTCIQFNLRQTEPGWAKHTNVVSTETKPSRNAYQYHTFHNLFTMDSDLWVLICTHVQRSLYLNGKAPQISQGTFALMGRGDFSLLKVGKVIVVSADFILSTSKRVKKHSLKIEVCTFRVICSLCHGVKPL